MAAGWCWVTVLWVIAEDSPGFFFTQEGFFFFALVTHTHTSSAAAEIWWFKLELDNTLHPSYRPEPQSGAGVECSVSSRDVDSLSGITAFLNEADESKFKGKLQHFPTCFFVYPHNRSHANLYNQISAHVCRICLQGTGFCISGTLRFIGVLIRCIVVDNGYVRCRWLNRPCLMLRHDQTGSEAGHYLKSFDRT